MCLLQGIQGLGSDRGDVFVSGLVVLCAPDDGSAVEVDVVPPKLADGTDPVAGFVSKSLRFLSIDGLHDLRERKVAETSRLRQSVSAVVAMRPGQRSRSLPMLVRKAVIRRRLPAFPLPIHECTSHIGVLVHGNRTPDVHEADPACRCLALRGGSKGGGAPLASPGV